MVRYFLTLILFFSFHLEAKKRIDVVSYSVYLLPSDFQPVKYTSLTKDYDVSFSHDLYKYINAFRADSPNLHKIIFFDYSESPKLFKLPKRKLICFKWEAIKILPKYYEPYSVVYTFDDDLVDGVKFFKFYYPVLKPLIPDVPAFEEKKLCTMVVGAWNPERIAMLDFFAAKPLGVFDLYGQAPPQYREHPMNKGRIPGYYSGSEKLSVLKNYRFCVCFENTHTTPGYITEKIFDTFAGGCVPIYWGPENVEKYIPKECFIDYRDFNTNEELYQYITTMTKERYEEYLDNIARYLTSEAASLFSVEYFEQLLYEAANR